MFETNDSTVLATIVALSVIVFFGVTAWVNLAREVPAWSRVALGVSALILAVSALFAFSSMEYVSPAYEKQLQDLAETLMEARREKLAQGVAQLALFETLEDVRED